MSSGSLPYVIVDVFAEHPFAGNQLAVVLGGLDLPSSAVLTLAREFGYSETVLIGPEGPGSGRGVEARYRARIATPAAEIPFAGHPTLGAAWVARTEGVVTGRDLVQCCGAGEIGVRVDAAGAEFTARRRDLTAPLSAAATGAVLAACGLDPSAARGPARIAGTGLSFCFVETDRAAVAAASAGGLPDLLRAEVAQEPVGPLLDPLAGTVLYAAVDEEIEARVFVPELGVAEDPATGSAAAGLGLLLAADGRDLNPGIVIRQGQAVGRPSVLRVRAVATAGRATEAVAVAGWVQHIARGEIRIP